MENFELVNTQLAIFFKEDLVRPDETFHKLNEYFDGIFKVPVILPIPTGDQYGSVPVVQVSSDDSLKTLTIARKRSDLILELQKDAPQSTVVEEEKMKELIKFFSFFKREVGVSPKRIGFVSRFFFRTSKENGNKMISNIIDPGFRDIFKGSEIRQASVQYATVGDFKNVYFNNRIVIEAGILKRDNKEVGFDGLVVLRDFNTLPENDYSQLKPDDVSLFIKEMSMGFELEKIWKTLKNPS